MIPLYIPVVEMTFSFKRKSGLDSYFIACVLTHERFLEILKQHKDACCVPRGQSGAKKPEGLDL